MCQNQISIRTAPLVARHNHAKPPPATQMEKKVWQIICLTLNHFHNGNPSAAGKPELLVFQRLHKIPPLQTKMQSNKSI